MTEGLSTNVNNEPEPARLSELEEQFDVEMAKELVAAYLEDTEDVLDRMQEAIIDRDAAALKSVSHMLKGASRIITASALESAASDMEELIASQNWLLAESKYEALKAVYTRTVDYLRLYLQ